MIFRLPVIHIFIAAFSLCLFSVSLFAQIFGNMAPCQLCLITRYLLLSIAIFSVIAFRYKPSRFMLFVIIFSLFVFSLYHLGVENHWWAGPQGCVSKLPSLSNMNEVIESNKVFCDKANWLIFGVSSTFWSFLASAFLTWLISTAYVLDYYLKRLTDD